MVLADQLSLTSQAVIDHCALATQKAAQYTHNKACALAEPRGLCISMQWRGVSVSTAAWRQPGGGMQPGGALSLLGYGAGTGQGRGAVAVSGWGARGKLARIAR
eukprot:1378391-Pleurochrysis_carterae.AAC.3